MAERAIPDIRSLLTPNRLKSLFRSDVVFASAIVAILALLVLPAPKWLLDILLAGSVAFSAMILMTALFTRKALEFSTFPAILLIATMLRLGLNIASTRLILSNGHEGPGAAGHVIEAFGSIVMQGNFVIGAIVFAILVIVNFVVITRGSGRIAEVAARFSLDAMPGKQMAIDADLSSGLLSEDEARAKRKQLEDESNFYGAMDGASKFVRGDAIAGLLITFVNIVGGVIIGVLQQGLSLSEAGQTYTLLTIGDGLVSQIPALIVSVAAGLLVSKAGVEGSADKAVMAQFAEYPKALALVAGLLLIISILPGMPFLPFAMLAAAIGSAAWTVSRHKKNASTDEKQKTKAAAPKAEDEPAAMLAMDELRIEIGYALLTLVNAEGGSPRLTDQIRAVRRAIAQELGFVTPPVRIVDNMQLKPQGYVIRLKEQEIARGDVRPGSFLVMDPSGKRLDLLGEPTREPAFGLDAMWVDASQREAASLKGFTVVDAATVLTTHLTEIIKSSAPELLSYAETKKLIDSLPDKHKNLVSDLVPNVVSVAVVQRVLQNLLAERVSIRDLPAILEAIAESAPHGNVGSIAEHVRARLARQICGALKGPDGSAAIITLSSQWEREFADALIGDGDNRQLSLAPSKLQEFVAAAMRKLETAAAAGEAAAIVTSARVRPFVRSVLERVRAQTMVLSQNEIHPHTRLKNLGQI
ncbi:MAG: flagellar biosynthesis protein FlhA [Parvularculaceae bacterium]